MKTSAENNKIAKRVGAMDVIEKVNEYHPSLSRITNYFMLNKGSANNTDTLNKPS